LTGGECLAFTVGGTDHAYRAQTVGAGAMQYLGAQHPVGVTRGLAILGRDNPTLAQRRPIQRQARGKLNGRDTNSR